MRQQVIFRDYQEEQAADHNDLQAYARRSMDDIVRDAVTATRRFAAFDIVKSAQVEVTVAPGRFYDQGGAVYARETALVQSLVTSLAAASKRIITLSVYGQENETDTAERDFLTNVETGATEPDSVPMTRSRDAVLAFTAGSESADPQPPTIPATHVAIAQIVVDTLQVVSVTMVETNRVASTDDLDQRADVLEEFKRKIEPRITSLASDLAALAARGASGLQKSAFASMFLDLARVKEKLRFPDTASDYGADFFLDLSHSDTLNAAALGYDAKVEEGIRFSDANANLFEIGLFSALDPNATLANGLLLPRYSDELKITTGAFASDLGMAQYGFQTTTMQQGFMSRSRLRYGGSLDVCSNGSNYNTPGQATDLTGLYDLTSTAFTAVASISYDPNYWAHESYRSNTYWLDTWKEPFLYAVTTEHVINGAQVAQSFLISNDTWASKIGFFITSKGGNEDIHLALCEVTNGVPNLDRVVMKTVLPSASILIGWNRVSIPATFLAKGKRFAVVVVSNANHKIGMAEGQGYLDGTFFYSTDGVYYQGDLTKDMMLEIYGAKFDASQVAIEFAPINLDGGLRTIDILAEMWVPDSAQLVWEMRPNGSGEWQSLTPDNAGVLGAAPALVQFRARFVGTRDMHAGIKLTGSRVKVSRPKLAFKHVSSLVTLANPSNEIHIVELLENFNDTPHDLDVTLRVGAVTETADTVTTKLINAADKRYEREFTFNLPAPVSSFRIINTGATNSPQDTYHVAERTHYSI
ncbi:hypothetical protein ONR75_11220 [Rhodopseudomonas sp. P2A-2r]|uniref:hypothetical protein n=1 Tax=Rhodopseudomonas sp. P2A-2r TaxID=2991972 RepID=UPI002234A5E2|nr:hypothetical protein [Rhodopseudomonas sp. P2A-2r]UZE51127.1 hypothetical protein ONR75_11220 [Rhodopseudomonas sp. P2A-2r]